MLVRLNLVNSDHTFHLNKHHMAICKLNFIIKLFQSMQLSKMYVNRMMDLSNTKCMSKITYLLAKNHLVMPCPANRKRPLF